MVVVMVVLKQALYSSMSALYFLCQFVTAVNTMCLRAAHRLVTCHTAQPVWCYLLYTGTACSQQCHGDKGLHNDKFSFRFVETIQLYVKLTMAVTMSPILCKVAEVEIEHL
jgi:hypothetical protein